MTMEFIGNFRAIEFKRADEAILYANARRRGEAILLGGRHYVMEQAEIDRLASAGVGFAYLTVREMPDGTERVMTVPVN
jgi:hypothetical protein